jgi:hypothetical protein
VGSNPTLSANNAGIAQSVERDLAKVDVESSNLFARSNVKQEGYVTWDVTAALKAAGA